MTDDIAAQMDRLYTDNPDPWNFRTSPYERAKFERTLASLPRSRYRHVLEVGCSIGTLGRRLATRADRYTGIDASGVALATARREAAANMAFAAHVVPDSFPEGRFDLIVLSEVLYFLSPAGITGLAAHVSQAGEADILCVNYLGQTGRPLDGTAAMEGFAAAFGRAADRCLVYDGYRIDSYLGRPQAEACP